MHASRAPLHALAGFLEVLRCGSLTGAARALNLTVSALSHQMRLLEERLGVQLLERQSRGVRPTAAGEQLRTRLTPAFEAIEAALARVAPRREDRLTLSLMPSMANGWLIPRLPDFVAKHPDVELNVHSGIELVDFRAGEVDAALRFGLGEWPGLIAEYLMDEWVAPVASPALLARLGVIDLNRLADYPVLSDPGDRWRLWCAEAGIAQPTRFVAHVPDAEALHRAALEGLGIGLGRQTLAQPLIDAGRLCWLSEWRTLANFRHYLVYPASSKSLRAFMSFRDWVHDQARA